MKGLVCSTGFTLVLIFGIAVDRATAISIEPPSITSGVSPTSESLSDKPAENMPQVKPNSLKVEVQPSSKLELEKPSPAHSKRGYPAYCDAYILNSIPGSWQFEQDIQRCIHGGG